MVLVSSLVLLALSSTALAATQNVTYDDTSSLIVYNPPESFTTHSNVASTFQLYNNTDTFGQAYNSTITMAFYATAVYLYGNLGDQHGNYTITLDGGSPVIVSGYAQTQEPPICLWSRTGLDLAVQHQVQMRQSTQQSPNFMELDRIILTTDPAIYQPGTNGVATAAASGATSSAQASGGGSSVPIGAIAGGAAGGVALLIAMAVLFWCMRRRKAAKGPAPDFTHFDTEGKAEPTPTPTSLVEPFALSFAAPPRSTGSAQLGSSASDRWEPSELASPAPSTTPALQSPSTPSESTSMPSSDAIRPLSHDSRPFSTATMSSTGFFALGGAGADAKSPEHLESMAAGPPVAEENNEAGPSTRRATRPLPTPQVDEELPPPAYTH